MSGIGIIANPHSKLNKRNPGRQELLGYILGERGQLAVTNTLEQLSTVAREFKEKDIGILAINGGDGTISRTLTAFIREYGAKPLPVVAILRGGTINMLATNLGIKGSPEMVLYRLVERHSSSQKLKTRKFRTLEIEGNYGFLFGNGVVASFLKTFYENKTGPIGSLLLLLRLVFAFFFNRQVYDEVIQNYEQTLTADSGEPRVASGVAVMCSTVERMPLGPRVFKGMRGKPEYFQVISYNIPADNLPWRLPGLITPTDIGDAGEKPSFLAEKMNIHSQTARSYTLDGELYEMTGENLCINLGPELEFIVV